MTCLIGREISTFSGFLHLREPYDPCATGSCFVIVAESSTREYHQMLTRVSKSISGSGISPCFGVDTSSAAIQISVESAGPQLHKGASAVPEIRLFSPIFSCKSGPR